MPSGILVIRTYSSSVSNMRFLILPLESFWTSSLIFLNISTENAAIVSPGASGANLWEINKPSSDTIATPVTPLIDLISDNNLSNRLPSSSSVAMGDSKVSTGSGLESGTTGGSATGGALTSSSWTTASTVSTSSIVSVVIVTSSSSKKTT